VPAEQTYPETQPALAVHEVPQALDDAQAYPLQVPGVAADWPQVPLPLQLPVVVEVTPLPEQVNVPGQVVPLAV
jgi:hypothetical protein